MMTGTDMTAACGALVARLGDREFTCTRDPGHDAGRWLILHRYDAPAVVLCGLVLATTVTGPVTCTLPAGHIGVAWSHSLEPRCQSLPPGTRDYPPLEVEWYIWPLSNAGRCAVCGEYARRPYGGPAVLRHRRGCISAHATGRQP
jgi:hypothetical protein